jgi:hypothetical protein
MDEATHQAGLVTRLGYQTDIKATLVVAVDDHGLAVRHKNCLYTNFKRRRYLVRMASTACQSSRRPRLPTEPLCEKEEQCPRKRMVVSPMDDQQATASQQSLP